MGGNQDNPVLGKLGGQIAEAHPLAGVQSAGGLVQNQDLRVIQKRLGDPHPPPHSAGELLDFFLPDVRQGNLLQQLADPPAALLLRKAF